MSDKSKGQFETADEQVVPAESKDTKENETVNEEKDTVKYATYKKLLNQRKKDAEELKELREFKEALEEKEAKEKGNYEALLKSREEKIQTLESKLTSYEQDLTEGTKLQAFVDRLPGPVKRQEYLSFVNLDEIALDPETKKVDEHSLKNAVDDFVKNYGDLLDKKENNTLPKVTSLGGRPNKKRSLKDLSREELRQAYLAGDFEE